MNDAILQAMRSRLGTGSLSSSSLSGGDINDVYRVSDGQKTYCVKVNSATRFPGMFSAEHMGLELLSSSRFRIPRVLEELTIEDTSALVMEFIGSGAKRGNFWETFGMNLAAMHKLSAPAFGLEHDNYIGSLPQRNDQRETWPEFYSEIHLEPMVKQAFDNHHFSSSDLGSFSAFYAELDNLFPAEPPALLHGDLWGGNYMVDEAGDPCLIDPAVYYGHREMDLGMMHLFGGFDSAVFSYYHNSYPLEGGWQDRIPFTQLYPLLVHVNLFGGGYVGQVKRIIDKFRP